MFRPFPQGLEICQQSSISWAAPHGTHVRVARGCVVNRAVLVPGRRKVPNSYAKVPAISDKRSNTVRAGSPVPAGREHQSSTAAMPYCTIGARSPVPGAPAPSRRRISSRHATEQGQYAVIRDGSNAVLLSINRLLTQLAQSQAARTAEGQHPSRSCIFMKLLKVTLDSFLLRRPRHGF